MPIRIAAGTRNVVTDRVRLHSMAIAHTRRTLAARATRTTTAATARTLRDTAMRLTAMRSPIG